MQQLLDNFPALETAPGAGGSGGSKLEQQEGCILAAGKCPCDSKVIAQFCTGAGLDMQARIHCFDGLLAYANQCTCCRLSLERLTWCVLASCRLQQCLCCSHVGTAAVCL